MNGSLYASWLWCRVPKWCLNNLFLSASDTQYRVGEKIEYLETVAITRKSHRCLFINWFAIERRQHWIHKSYLQRKMLFFISSNNCFNSTNDRLITYFETGISIWDLYFRLYCSHKTLKCLHALSFTFSLKSQSKWTQRNLSSTAPLVRIQISIERKTWLINSPRFHKSLKSLNFLQIVLPKEVREEEVVDISKRTI